MKMPRFLLVAVVLAAPAWANLPSYGGWPKCAPVLAVSANEIGVAAFETFRGPKPAQRWVCLVVDRDTLVVAPVGEADFDARFPGARERGNRTPGDCHEMIKNVAPASPGAEPPACIETKVLCAENEVKVAVPASVAKVACPGRVFSAATVIEGKLWAAVNPLDIYFRELDGSGLVIQPLDAAAGVTRATSLAVGGRSVCAIRQDPRSKNIWVTTENGLAELGPDGHVKTTLKFNGSGRPMLRR